MLGLVTMGVQLIRDMLGLVTEGLQVVIMDQKQVKVSGSVDRLTFY